MELMLEDIVGVLMCTPCAVHFNCYEIVPQLWKSTFMCEQDSKVGNIISMGLALGPMSRIMTRSLYDLLWSRHAWCEHLEINRGVQRELEFWRSSSCVAQYNAQPIWLSPSAIRLV